MDLDADSINLNTDQEVEVNVKKIGTVALILLLAVTTIYYHQKVQKLETGKDNAVVKAESLQSQINRLESTLTQTNKTLNFVQDRNDNIREENGHLRMIADRPLVTLRYRSRTGTDIDLDAINYGNTTARNVQGSCRVYRDAGNVPYDSFSISIEELPERTIQTIRTEVTLSGQPKSTDTVDCQVTSCEGICQPLGDKIENFETNYTVRQFN